MCIRDRDYFHGLLPESQPSPECWPPSPGHTRSAGFLRRSKPRKIKVFLTLCPLFGLDTHILRFQVVDRSPALHASHMFSATTTHLVVRIHVDFGRSRNMMCRP